MEIPSLPTDNLYKFSALCGLLIIVIGLGYPSSKMFEIQLYLNDVTTEVAISTARADAFQRLSDRLGENPERTREQIEQYESTRDAGLESSAALMKKTDRVAILVEQNNFYFAVGVGFSIAGLVLSCWGFTNWLRLQRASDAMVLNQLGLLSSKPSNSSLSQPESPGAPID